MAITLDSNLYLFSIPIVYTIALIPHAMKMGVVLQSGLKYDNMNPRELEYEAAKKDIPEPTLKKIQRLKGAHVNGLETFPLFVGALLTGHVAGLSSKILNIFSLAYIVNRLAYNYVYATQTSAEMAKARSFFWISGIIMSYYICIEAGLVHMNKSS